ncbi:MAG: transketolase [Nanoarchaeota archaeon]|nr:transketolase [Nanoarchaeota archaeon]
MQTKELELKANQIRQDIIEMLYIAKSGHSAGAIGMADIFTVLYNNILKHNPKKPNSNERDFVILSNGHICPVLYATLAQNNYFPKSKLKTLRQLGTKLQGHPHNLSLPGIENSSGSLGQGISQAVGLASSLKRDKKSNKVYCFVGDGELEEGQCWEAIMFAAKEKLNNLILIVDRNFIQIDGNTQNIINFGNLNKKFTAFNWTSIDIDGNNLKQIYTAFNEAKKNKLKPTCIIANTIPGKGITYMENNYKWHGKAPNEEEKNLAIKELNLEKELILKKLNKNTKI